MAGFKKSPGEEMMMTVIVVMMRIINYEGGKADGNDGGLVRVENGQDDNC